MNKSSICKNLSNELNRWNVHGWNKHEQWSKAYAFRAENDALFTWVICEHGVYAYRATGLYDLPYQAHSDDVDRGLMFILSANPNHIVHFDRDIFKEISKGIRNDFVVKLCNTFVNGKYLKRMLKVMPHPAIMVSDNAKAPVFLNQGGMRGVLMPFNGKPKGLDVVIEFNEFIIG